MNLAGKSLSILLVLPLVSTPAFADFKYTDTSQITGGALMGMASFAAKFSKDSRAAMQPITTTHYVKGNKMRIGWVDPDQRSRWAAGDFDRQREEDVFGRDL
jgi:hypothetical protein